MTAEAFHYSHYVMLSFILMSKLAILFLPCLFYGTIEHGWGKDFYVTLFLAERNKEKICVKGQKNT